MNEQSPENVNIEPEPVPEEVTDMEFLEWISWHIDNPCGPEKGREAVLNLRDFYLREAERALARMENPDARRLLELKIEQYRKKS